MHQTRGILEPSALQELIVESLDNDKAFDIEVIDLGEQSSSLADYMVVASGTSSRQVVSLSEKLKDRLNSLGYKDIKIEGTDQGNWVVLDVGDVIIHLFKPEVREFYDIEKMWRAPTPNAETHIGIHSA